MVRSSQLVVRTLALSVSLAVLGLAAAAHAQAPAGAAPESTSDLSEINGQLVKVGEHNEYHYGFKPTMITSDPLGWVTGRYALGVTHAFHANVAVRADAAFLAPTSGGHGYELSLGAPIFLRRAYQGAFLEPGVIVKRSPNSYSFDPPNETKYGPQMLIGWQQIWDSGLSIAVAGGVARDLSATNDDDDYGYGSPLFATGYLKVGFAF